MIAKYSLMASLCPKIKQRTNQPMGIYKPPILLFFLFLCFVFAAKAQEAVVHAPPVAKAEIQIGDLVPDVLLEKVLNYKTNTIQLSEFKNKILILDFWATWCAPCVKMIPRMDSLQKKYDDKIQFLSVTSQTQNEVLPFLERMEKVHGTETSLPYAIEDNLLRKMFPHGTLPHYVWINGNGKVLAITDMDDVNEENILKAIDGSIQTTQKKEAIVPLNHKKPLFFNEESLRGTSLLFHRILTGYIEGYGGGNLQTISVTDDNDEFVNGPYRRISSRNLSVAQLYQMAYVDGKRNFGWHNTRIEAKDKSKLWSGEVGAAYRAWQQKNSYCYELIVHKSQAAQAWDLMKEDLRKEFPQYKAEIENRSIPSFCLIRTSETDKIKSEGGERILDMGSFGGRINQYSIRIFLRELNDKGLRRYSKPLVDLTGYKNLVDISLEADFANIESINNALARYDLKLIEQDQVEEVLIISDQN